MESSKFKTTVIYILCIIIFILLAIIFIKIESMQKENYRVISACTLLHTLDAIAANYENSTGKDIYDESKNIQELLDTLVKHKPYHPTFFNDLQKRLNDKRFILYLIKSGNEGSYDAPVIICQLANGKCLTMTRGKYTFSTWDRETSRHIPTSVFNKINNGKE